MVGLAQASDSICASANFDNRILGRAIDLDGERQLVLDVRAGTAQVANVAQAQLPAYSGADTGSH